MSLPSLTLSHLSDLIATRLGWHFPPDRWQDLERGIRGVAHDLGFTNVQACIDWLHAAPLSQQQIAVLADHFTVGETYFFREQRSLDILSTHILPPLLLAQHPGARPLRIWSAACCTGEEPYSIAMLIANTLPHLTGERVAIIGTDINPRFLQRATSGIYTEWSFRNTPAWAKSRYFHPTDDGRFVLSPEIKQRATFLPLNLADDTFPAPLNAAAVVDVIFCRNVFIYFSPERAQKVILHFHHLLADGGWLIVSPSEIPYLVQSPFTAVSFPGAIIHRKNEPAHQATIGERSFSLSSQRWLATNPGLQPSPNIPSPVQSPVSDHTRRDTQSGPPPPPQTRPSPLPSQSSGRSTPQVPPYEEAKSLYTQGRYLEVCEKLQPTLAQQDSEQTPFNPEEVLLLIRACANQGALDEARTWCHKAIATDALNPSFYYLLATVLLEQKKEEEAIQTLRQALYLDSKFILAHFTLGNIALRQKKTKDARRHFQNARGLLREYEPAAILPESEGLTAKQLSDLIDTMSPR